MLELGAQLGFVDSPPLLPAYVAQVSACFPAGGGAEAEDAPFGVRLPASMARALPKRRLEFAAGRRCAARAVAAILPGFAGEIETAPDRAPCWPAGVLGSITHAGGFASAAVAPAARARGVGIDTEVVAAPEVARAVRDVVLNAADAPAPPGVLSTPGLTDEVAFTLVFSAKESVFKCLYPIVRRMFFFEHVAVTLVPGQPAFRAVLLSDLGADLPAGFTLAGRYAVAPPFVHTGVVLER